MNDAQILALGAMLFVGIPGIGVAIDIPENSKKLRITGALWVAVWWLPPMAMLWIKGVFG